MSIEERRRYQRRPFVKPIRYYLRALHMEIRYNGVSVDISKGGIGIITNFPLMKGDILYFEPEIKVNEHVEKSSIVRWVKEIEYSRYRVGMEFLR